MVVAVLACPHGSETPECLNVPSYVVVQSPGHACVPQAGTSSIHQFACWSYSSSKLQSGRSFGRRKQLPQVFPSMLGTSSGCVTLDKPDSFSCLCSRFSLSPHPCRIQGPGMLFRDLASLWLKWVPKPKHRCCSTTVNMNKKHHPTNTPV